MKRINDLTIQSAYSKAIQGCQVFKFASKEQADEFWSLFNKED